MNEAQRLRDEIANDLLALRRTLRQAQGGTVAGRGAAAADARESLTRLFRNNPAWVAAVASGALAGLWVAARGRRQKAAGSRP